MKIYDNYIIILASLFLTTTVVFALLDETRLDLCFTVYLIETLVLNELCIYLNPRAKKQLNSVNYVLFAGFLAIVVAKVIDIICGFNYLEVLWGMVKLKAIEVLRSMNLL